DWACCQREHRGFRLCRARGRQPPRRDSFNGLRASECLPRLGRRWLRARKAHIDPTPYFANRLSQFAKRFIDTALMGLPESGSYVVTAFVPVDEVVPLHSARLEGLGLDLTTVRTRDITESIIRAMEATTEALRHFYTRNSYVAFEDYVGQGVSFEMLHSL